MVRASSPTAGHDSDSPVRHWAAGVGQMKSGPGQNQRWLLLSCKVSLPGVISGRRNPSEEALVVHKQRGAGCRSDLFVAEANSLFPRQITPI